MKRLALTSTLVLSAGLAQTQNSGQVQYVLTQDLVQRSTENGKEVEVIVPNPKAVMPGDILREEVTLKNVSGKNLSRVQVTIPVPRSTEFAGSATTNRDRFTLTYSADGGKTYSTNPTRSVTVTENGKTVTKQVTAPANTYTGVRWVVTTLQSDESLKLSFRVKVK